MSEELWGTVAYAIFSTRALHASIRAATLALDIPPDLPGRELSAAGEDLYRRRFAHPCAAGALACRQMRPPSPSSIRRRV